MRGKFIMSDKISKKRIFDIIQIGYYGDWQSKAFDIMVIVMSIFALFPAGLFPSGGGGVPDVQGGETVAAFPDQCIL